jgi:hypothetical protein
MKTRILLASLTLLAAGCSREGASEGEKNRETPLQVASRPFTIGNDVADQMGTHVGDMGTDREGDPALNALADEADVPVDANAASPDTAAPEEGRTPPSEDGSRFTTEGGPEG